MKPLLLGFALPFLLSGQPTLFSCVSSTKDFVVGARLPTSGLFLKEATGGWLHAGYNHPFVFSVDYDDSALYLAAGNGLIRTDRKGQNWKWITGSDVTELRDVAVDRRQPGTIYFSHSHGIRVSSDRGANWREIAGGLHRKFVETLQVDRARAGILLAGGEEGIFRSDDGGAKWVIAGAAGFQISRLVQSPHEACEWLATSQRGGLFGSTDCGKTFENIGRLGVGSNLYDVAFDPLDARRLAVVGWGPGVAISEDRGKTWSLRNTGLSAPQVISVVFDPARAGRLYVSVNDDAVYVSNDYGAHWTKDGLDGSAVSRMRFIP